VFTLTGNTGTIVRWEYSTNGGGSWSKDNSNPQTGNSITYVNANADRRYRAVTSGCGGGTLTSNSVGITTSQCNTRTTAPATTESAPATEVQVIAGKLEATAYPNPSQSYFNLQVKSSNTADVEIKVFDISGKLVDQLKGASYQTYKFGNKLVAGTYIVEVRQGTERVTTKVVKF